MSKEKPMAESDTEHVSADSFDRKIVAALADKIFPPLPESDAEQPAQPSTREHQQVVEILGTPEEFGKRMLMRVLGPDLQREPSSGVITEPPRESADATRAAGDDDTVGQPSTEEPAREYAPEIGELNHRMLKVEALPKISLKTCYRKIRELGRGFQGVVYLTEDGNEAGGEPANVDEWTGKQALKMFSPERYRSAAAYQEEMGEMSRVASVIHPIHPDNLIHVQRFFKYQGIYMMVMQAIDGLDLRRLLNADLLQDLRNSVDEQRWNTLDSVIYSRGDEGRVGLRPLMAVTIIEKCLRGLGVLHRKGIVHGDIKPSNIMLDRYGSIRLIDIGSAHRFAETRQRTWTPKYAPPEFLKDGTWTPQSDLASLGYVLVELLSGHADLGTPTIGDESAKDANNERDKVLLEAKLCLPDRLLDILPSDVTRCGQLVELCQRLIDPNPDNRFTDAAKALSNNSNGAWDFRMEMIRCRLNVHEPTAIEELMEDVMNMEPKVKNTVS